MKKMMIVMVALIAIGFTSCTKEELTDVGQKPITSSSLKTGVVSDPELPTGETQNLEERQDLKDKISQLEEYNKMISQDDIDFENSQVVYYGNQEKLLVCFPVKNEYNRYYCFLLKGMEFYLCKQVILSGTDDYLSKMPNGILFEERETPWSGQVKVSSIVGEDEGIITVTSGQARLTWTHHGGFASWTDCVENYGSQWWVIIGGCLCPGAVGAGLAIGCL